MSQTLSLDDRAVTDAAIRAGVQVRELAEVTDLAAAELLVQHVWGGGEDKLSLSLLKALVHSGNYVAGAWIDRELAGVSVAWAWGSGPAPALHSHITGIAPSHQGRGVGLALKLHQAAWARARGMATITWTFDPLIRRNAWFNLMKLGARAVSYHPDFYGQLLDGINDGEPSDRCMVVWSLAPGPPRAVPDVGAAAVLLAQGSDREPAVSRFDPSAALVACQVPADAVALRREAPELAARWRSALRQAMGEAMAAGYVATSLTTDGYYILERKPD